MVPLSQVSVSADPAVLQQAYASMDKARRDIRNCHRKVPIEGCLDVLRADALKIQGDIGAIRHLLLTTPQDERAKNDLEALRDDYLVLETRIDMTVRKVLDGQYFTPCSHKMFFDNERPLAFEEARWVSQSGADPVQLAARMSNPAPSLPFVTDFAPAPFGDAPELKAWDAASASAAGRQTPAPFTLGRPTGIYRAGMNCWANAILQLFRHIPSVYAFIHDPRNNFTVLTDFYKAYNSAPEATVPRNADSQLVRAWLSERTSISPLSSKMEDASDVLNFILGNFPGNRLELRRASSAQGQVVREERARNCMINARDESGNLLDAIPLDRLFVKNYLEGNNETRRFYESPTELILTINRNEQVPPRPLRFVKMNDDMNIPLNITIPGRSIIPPIPGREAAPVTMGCKAFIVHRGTSMNGGHYVAYRLFGGQWFEFDDHTVTPVSEARIKEIIKKAYSLYYAK